MSASSSILNQLSTGFPSDVIGRIAGSLGENPARTKSALGGALPALLDGLTHKAETTEGAGAVIDMIKQNHFDTDEFANAASAVAAPDGVNHMIDAGRPLVGSILGKKSDSVIDSVASLGGIKKSSSSSLLSLATPVLLSLVAKHMSSIGWSASNLKNMLTGQRGVEREAFATPVEHPASYRPVERVYAPEPVRRESNWWKWALALLALIPILYFLLSRNARLPHPEVSMPSVPAPAVAPTVPPANLGPMTQVKLPNGVTLNVPGNGVETRLLAFIKDPNRKVDDKTWFSFDRLEFNTDSDVLKPGSEEQIRNIAAIEKAYPNVNLKIGGYTDNVGDEAHNLDLSQRRATKTMDAIAAAGVDRSRLSAEGYGEQFPVADNSTAEGRDRNRRIDMRVTSK
jgi:outer membrane protein OmpA-like peptidoglycan-associated protein